MRIVILGGSAFSTPNLIQFLDRNQGPERMEVVLAGRSVKKLEATRRASSLLGSGTIDIRVERIAENTWGRVLDGADCVVIQIRVGGYEGRLFDETFLHKYGICGDEGLGASGLSAGWRTWPVIAEILEAIEKFCPRAFVILLTSPLSLLVRASYKCSRVNVLGICELPWTTLQDVAKLVEKPERELEADYLGVNHLGWFYNFRTGSHSLLEEVAAAIGEDSFPTGGFLRAYRCLPTRYLQMHYEQEKAFAKQVSQTTSRAKTLAKLQDNAYNKYSEGSARDIASVLEARRAPWYSQAVGPLLLGLSGQPTDIEFFLSAPNGSYTGLLQPDDALEFGHRWVGGELVRVPLSGPPPDHLAENLTLFVLFERVATEAIMNRSLPLLTEALSLHPWTQGHAQLRSIANEIVSYNETVPAVACQ